MDVTVSQVREVAYAMIKELSEKSLAIYGVKVSPTLDFSIKGMSCCGRANRRENKIYINMQIAIRNFEDFKDTIIHEYAHLLDNKVYQQFSHGPTWKSIMVNLGGNPKSKAKGLNMEGIEKARKTTSYDYECACRIHTLSSVRHNKIKNKKMTYSCKNCKTNLVFKSAKIK